MAREHTRVFLDVLDGADGHLVDLHRRLRHEVEHVGDLGDKLRRARERIIENDPGDAEQQIDDAS